MRHSDAIMTEPFILTIEMDRLRLNAPFLLNEVIWKLFNLKETPVQVPMPVFVCGLEGRYCKNY